MIPAGVASVRSWALDPHPAWLLIVDQFLEATARRDEGGNVRRL
jgi:hypothetical protein